MSASLGAVKRFWPAAAGAILLLLAIGLLLGPWRVGAPNDPPETALFLADIYGPNVVSQQFVALTDNLLRIDLWLRNPNRAPWIAVTVSLPDVGTIYEGRIPLQDVREPTRYTIAFAPLRRSAGRTVELRLFAPELSEAESPAVLLASTIGMGKEAGLSLNGRPVAGELALALYARPTGVRTLGQIARVTTEPYRTRAELAIRRIGQYKPQPFKGRSLAALIAFNLGLIWIAAVYLLYFPQTQDWNLAQFSWRAILTGLIGLTGLLLIGGVIQSRWQPVATRLSTATHSALPDLPAGPRVVCDLIAALADDATVVQTPPGNPEYVAARWLAAPDGQKPALWMHPPSRVSFPVEVPPEGRLAFSVGLDAETWQKPGSDGVEFVITVSTAESIEQVYWRVVDPANVAEDRRWFDEQIDLSHYAGQEVTLTLSTYPRGNNSWDWAGWGHPVIVGRSLE